MDHQRYFIAAAACGTFCNVSVRMMQAKAALGG